MGRISDLIKVFRELEFYDFEIFPKFSQRKRELKETQGVIKVIKEIQQIIDDEK